MIHLHMLVVEDQGIRIKVWSTEADLDWGEILELCNRLDPEIRVLKRVKR
jgi:hypothetical protein